MIKQLVSSEFCLGCRGCCRYKEASSCWSPRLMKEEVEVMVDNGLPPALLAPDDALRIEYSQEEGSYLCGLLSPKDNKCTLYRFRPFECQLYPVLLLRRENRYYLAVDTHCPYIEATKGTKEYKEYCASMVQLLENPVYNRMLRTNLHLFQDYPKVDIIAELTF